MILVLSKSLDITDFNLIFDNCLAPIFALTTPALKSLSVSPSTGSVHRLSGEAAGVQQVHPAPLQAELGGGRLVRPLQGAAGHGPLPRPQVIGDEGEVTLKVSSKRNFIIHMQRTKRSPRDRKYSSAGAKVTKERDSAPLCLGVIPNSLVRASAFL